MAFRARVSHPLGTEIGRILADLAAGADHALVVFDGDPHGAIHSLRTAMKKIRAVLALAAPELPGAPAGRARELVRALKDHYANTRDEQILRGLFLKLAGAREQAALESLFAPAAADPPPPSAEMFERVKELREVLACLPFWVVTVQGVGGAFAAAVDKCSAWRGTCKSGGNSTDFHEWRKAVKRVWVQAEVLRRRVRGLGAAAGLAGELGELLGGANDLANLGIRLGAAADILPAAFFQRLDGRLARLRKRALKRSSKLHARLDGCRVV